MVLQTCTGGLTHVRRARVEECVCVGDELQLSVQVGQAGTGKGHAHLTVASHLHSIHVRGHVQRPQSGGDVHLQVGDRGWEESVGRGQGQGRHAGPLTEYCSLWRLRCRARPAGRTHMDYLG